MKAALAFMLLLFSSAAYAQAPQVTGAQVTEYGIYTRDVLNREAVPGTAAGTKNVVGNVRFALQTSTIPAQKGVSFGIHYVVAGTPSHATVRVREVTIFPAVMTNPATGKSSTRFEEDTSATIGEAKLEGYNLGNDWEIIPGMWTFQVWYQGSKLAEQTFVVQK
ncbi:MAG TPA: DUF3859 domain-containing protein [Stellaceae bacterium]|nr:DUF3859 domain-containing protein [Stellaceae bacterium]